MQNMQLTQISTRVNEIFTKLFLITENYQNSVRVYFAIKLAFYCLFCTHLILVNLRQIVNKDGLLQ